MKPTIKLRFVRRAVPDPTFGEDIIRHQNILQQWWEDNSTDIHWVNGAPGEWRDIPVEEENS